MVLKKAVSRVLPMAILVPSLLIVKFGILSDVYAPENCCAFMLVETKTREEILL